MFKRAATALAIALLLIGCGDRTGAPVASQASSAVVTDADTGLVWLRCAIGQRWENNRCAGDAETLNFMDAQTRVNQLATEHYQGINTWRLPTIVELAALRRCDHGLVEDTFTLETMPEEEPLVIRRWCAKETTVPTIDAKRFPDTPLVDFWSGSGSEQNQVFYTVHFGNAWIGLNEYAETPHAVRPVANAAR